MLHFCVDLPAVLADVRNSEHRARNTADENFTHCTVRKVLLRNVKGLVVACDDLCHCLFGIRAPDTNRAEC